MSEIKLPEWAQNPIAAAAVGVMFGVTGAGGTFLGIDMVGLDDLKSDVARLEAKVESYENLQYRVDKLETYVAEVTRTLNRVDKNLLLLCQRDADAKCIGN